MPDPSKLLKIAASFLIPILAQVIVLVWWTTWWASGIDVKVKASEGLLQQNLLIIDRLSRVEARVDVFNDQLTRIANIIDNKYNVNYYEESRNEEESIYKEKFF